MSTPHTGKSNGQAGPARMVTSSVKLPIRGKKRKQQIRKKTHRQMMLADLKRSGLTAKDAKTMGCKPITGEVAKQKLKLSKVNLPDGFSIPYFDIDGCPLKGAFRWRALDDYTQRNRRTTKRESGPKYRQPARTEPWLYLAPFIEWAEYEGKVVITEGEKKSACACKSGIAAIGLGGVWNWKVPKSNDELLPSFDEVLYEDSDVEICFDSNTEQNSNVRLALIRLAKALETSGRRVQVVHLPSGENGEKVGLDDFLVAAGTKNNGKFSFKRARRKYEKLHRHDPPELEPVTSRCAADIRPQSLLPIWPGVINRKKVTLVAGEPGLGKSLLTCDVAARVTRGRDWPGGISAVTDPSNVVIISGEDDAEDTIVPRLIASGADLSRVHIIDDVIENKDGNLSALSIDAHVQDIHKEMLRRNAKLLIIDPISAFMGERDSYKDTAVRSVINKLRRLAKESEYAVLVITHFNKPGEKTTSAIYRVMGSLGFVAAARASFAFLRDPVDPERRLMLPIKVNLGPDQDGFGCSIEVDTTQNLRPPPPYLSWENDALEGERVDEVLTQSSPRAQARKVKEQEIEKWLEGYLEHGKKVRATKFNREMKERGYSDRLVRELLPQYGYKKKQIGFGKKCKWWVIRD